MPDWGRLLGNGLRRTRLAMSAADEAQRLLAERSCERLILRYAHLIDGGDAEKVPDLFAEDGVWESEKRKAIGREQIREVFRQRAGRTGVTSRHVCTNTTVDVLNAREAVGLTYYTLYRYGHGSTPGRPLLEGPVMVGDYRDRFVRTAGGWRFAHRRATAAFVKPRATDATRGPAADEEKTLASKPETSAASDGET